MGWRCLAVVALVLLPVRGRCAPVAAPHVHVDLVADAASVQPGRELSLGVRFVLEEGWHVYWRNPGDSGEAPSVEWTLPAGFAAGELEWPTPEPIPSGPLAASSSRATCDRALCVASRRAA